MKIHVNSSQINIFHNKKEKKRNKRLAFFGTKRFKKIITKQTQLKIISR